MRILVVTQHYWPEQYQSVPLCEGLAERGHEVTVLCGLPNYRLPGREDDGVVPEEYRHGQRREEDHNGVHIVRAFEIGRHRDNIHRVLNYYSFQFSGNRKVRTLDADFDVVFAFQSSPVMMASPAVEYRRITGTPVYLYCLDLWPESLKAKLKDKGKPIISYYGGVSRKIYQGVDLIGVQSPLFIPYFEEYHGISKERLVYHPMFSMDEPDSESVESPHEGFNIVFLGNMGVVQGIPNILSAIKLLDDVEGLTMHFVGKGEMLPWAEQYVQENGLSDRVVFYGERPLEEMRNFYAIADVCVLAIDSNSLIGVTIPNKLQGYMAAGKAVVGAVGGSARSVIEESGCGIAVSPDDVSAMADAIRELAFDKERRVACGKAGRAYYLKNFTREAYLDSLEEELARTSEMGQKEVLA